MAADLPPLTSLRAFEAAARLGSFQSAGAELGVSASAVSHQIKALEAWIGAPLFVRVVRAVRLTAQGRDLARNATAAFAMLSGALAYAKAGARETRLRISALPLFVNVWLTPRLARYQSLHPEVAIEVDTENRLADLDADGVDVAIRNVYAPTPGLAARKLLDLHATPLCTPALARTLATPADLKGATLIHISSRDAAWRGWLSKAGEKGLRPKANLSFDTIPSALEAAAQGRGVILGLLPLIWDAPSAAALVAPFNLEPISAGTYFVVCRRQDRTRALVRDFVEWLLAEMHADVRRLARLSKRR